MLPPSLAEHGYCFAADVVATELRERLLTVFAEAVSGRAGNRAGLEHAAVRELATSPAVRALVEPVLGGAAFAHRATLFDKTADANWLVAWHQDLVVPVRQRREVAGFGPWSQKEGIWYVQPTAAVLEGLLAVRVDLDGSDAGNGALRVLTGSHRRGVLLPPRVAALANEIPPAVCAVPPCGALVLRPLLLHASSRASVPTHRRIVHLEFAPAPLPGGLTFHECVH